MTQQQIKFAAHHDWFLESPNSNTILVMDYATNEDGLMVMEPRTFTDFQALLEWAGY